MRPPFGHALIAADDATASTNDLSRRADGESRPGPHFAEAQRVLKAAVSRDRENPFAWYVLGEVYEESRAICPARGWPPPSRKR